MGALLREPPSRRLPDAAAATDDHHDVPGQELGRALPRDLLLDLPALQRPVLELEDVRFGDELEPIHRLRVRDGLQHRPVAEIGGDRAALVGERGDHAEPGSEDHLGPVVERALARPGVSPVVLLVLGPRGGELAPDLAASLIGRRCRGRGPARPAAARPGAGAPASPCPGAPARAFARRPGLRARRRRRRSGGSPAPACRRAANHRQHQLRQAAPLVRRRSRTVGAAGRAAARPRRLVAR